MLELELLQFELLELELLQLELPDLEHQIFCPDVTRGPSIERAYR